MPHVRAARVPPRDEAQRLAIDIALAHAWLGQPLQNSSARERMGSYRILYQHASSPQGMRETNATVRQQLALARRHMGALSIPCAASGGDI
jgi:hypothetical protein